MKKNLFIHIPICVILLLLLFVEPDRVSATSFTPKVAVPLSSSKNDLIRTKSYTPTVGYTTITAKGNDSPLHTVSSSTVRSWNAGTLQNAATGGSVAVSAIASSTTPVAISVPHVGYYSLRPTMKATTTYEEEGLTRTKRRAYGTDYEEGDTKYNSTTGKWEMWNGKDWVDVDSPAEPPVPLVPVGDMPFVLIIAMVVGYIVRSKVGKAT